MKEGKPALLQTWLHNNRVQLRGYCYSTSMGRTQEH